MLKGERRGEKSSLSVRAKSPPMCRCKLRRNGKQGRGLSMRTSSNELKNGRLMNGYDYENQAWVVDGKYVRCGHPENMKCGCCGREHEGEETK